MKKLFYLEVFTTVILSISYIAIFVAYQLYVSLNHVISPICFIKYIARAVAVNVVNLLFLLLVFLYFYPIAK